MPFRVVRGPVLLTVQKHITIWNMPYEKKLNLNSNEIIYNIDIKRKNVFVNKKMPNCQILFLNQYSRIQYKINYRKRL